MTVATAVHWFDFDRFYAEVERVLAPGGALAVWAYNLARVTPEVDVLIDRLARELVGPYWPPERRWVDEDYRTLPFPFDEVATPQLWIEERWDLPRAASTTSAPGPPPPATAGDRPRSPGDPVG